MDGSRWVKAFAAGVLGACVLTVAHELLRRYLPHAPRLDILGMKSIARASRASGAKTPDRLHESALMSDLISNAGYYSLVGIASREKALYVGAGLGLAAGLGAVTMPGPLGLGTAATARRSSTQVMTVALYTTGGLIAGSLYRALN